MKFKQMTWLMILVLIGIGMMGCQAKPIQPEGDTRIPVAATTSIVADVVRQVGGEAIELVQIIPNGTDPHSFSPAPQDLSQISRVKVVFVNGAGLEESLLKVIANAVPEAKLVEVSRSNHFIEGHDDGHAQGTGEEEHAFDPHTWTDPNNVIQWVDVIVAELSQIDPSHQESYRANGEAYKQQLKELDLWVQNQIAQIPVESRKLVTDHLAWGYFAQRYGFEQIGAIIPGFSTLAEPSAQEIAALEDQIRAQNIRAIFLGNQTNPALAQRIADDTGAKVVTLYSGTLSDVDGPAPTYLEYIRYNVNAIVNALK